MSPAGEAPFNTPTNGITTDAPVIPDEPVRVRKKDAIFWTELEIRRLGNLVAECIHARRYIGDTTEAEEERRLMRTYINAMKQKAMRVMHRAEQYSQRGLSAWPGIDSSITDPESLAEEYVRVVQNYEAVLTEEETRAREKRKEQEENGEEVGVEVVENEAEDWEVADDIAYREAVEREMKGEQEKEEMRNELLGEAEGLRRRKGEEGDAIERLGKYSKEDEELMAKHQPVQDELTANLVELVGELKKSVQENNDILRKDVSVLDEAEDLVDKNVAGIDKQRKELQNYTKSASTSWWVLMIIAVIMTAVAVFVFILLKVPL